MDDIKLHELTRKERHREAKRRWDDRNREKKAQLHRDWYDRTFRPVLCRSCGLYIKDIQRHYKTKSHLRNIVISEELAKKNEEAIQKFLKKEEELNNIIKELEQMKDKEKNMVEEHAAKEIELQDRLNKLEIKPLTLKELKQNKKKGKWYLY